MRPTTSTRIPTWARAGRVALVHNGIIENFVALRGEVEAAGRLLTSETDTEIAAHLVEMALEECGTLTEAMQQVCGRLNGAFTLVAVDGQDPDRVVAARRNSPLVVGVGDGENFLASDVAAFIEHTREALELGQDQVVTITRDGVEVTDFDGNPAQAKPYHVDWDLSAAEKGGFDWFMRKEIHEQPKAIADSMLGRHDEEGALQLDDLRITEEELRGVDKIIIVGCGTAFYAGMVAKYAIEHWTRIPCEVELAHEFRYRDPILTRDTLVVAISQSGETADTLMAIRHAREQRSKVLAICNTNGSTIPRESDAVIYTHAGPEIGVASTKGFMTQLVACYLLGLYLAQVRGTKFGDEIAQVVARARADAAGTCSRSSTRPRPVHALARGARRRRSPCCSSAGTRATRSRSKVRSSSRSSPTSTPRASRPASSSTARSRWSRTGCRCSASCRPRGGTSCTTRWSAGSRRSGPAAHARSCWPRRATTR